MRECHDALLPVPRFHVLRLPHRCSGGAWSGGGGGSVPRGPRHVWLRAARWPGAGANTPRKPAAPPSRGPGAPSETSEPGAGSGQGCGVQGTSGRSGVGHHLQWNECPGTRQLAAGGNGCPEQDGGFMDGIELNWLE